MPYLRHEQARHRAFKLDLFTHFCSRGECDFPVRQITSSTGTTNEACAWNAPLPAYLELQVSTEAVLDEVAGAALPCRTTGKHNIGLSAVTIEGDVITTARPTTWGALKLLYRVRP